MSWINKSFQNLPENKLDELFARSLKKLPKNVDREKINTASENWKKLSLEEKRNYCVRAWNKAKKDEPEKAAKAESRVEAEIKKCASEQKSEHSNISEEFLDENAMDVIKRVLSVFYFCASICGILFTIILLFVSFPTALCCLVASGILYGTSQILIAERQHMNITDKTLIIDEMADIEIYFLEKYDISLYENILLSEGALKSIGDDRLIISHNI